MKNNKKIFSGFFLVVLILAMSNLAFAFPITGRVIEVSPSETILEKCPEIAVLCEKGTVPQSYVGDDGCTKWKCIPQAEKCPQILVNCIEGTVPQSYVGDDGCTKWKCVPKKQECPENCICKANTITCPTTQEKPIEVEISTSEGSTSISVEKIAEDSISIKEGSTSVKTSKKLVIEEKKLLMETSQGNKEVKIMPSTASETAINQLKLKNYEIELKDVGKPVYEITGKKDVKVIGFINAEMAVKSQINAETGAVEKTEKPWWSFLAKE